jgi:glycosyltransferase involved in cell wall biosynthesis
MNAPAPHVMIVISQVSDSHAMEMLDAAHDATQVRLSYVLLHSQETPFERTLRARGRAVTRIHFSGKRNLLTALLALAWQMIRHRPRVVHAHLFEASLVAMSVAWLLGIKTRISTRHYSSYHHDYHPQAVRYDRWINARATRLLAVSRVVEKVLVEREGVPRAKVTVLPHGFSLAHFAEVSAERVQAIRAKYAIGPGPCIGVISRFTHWKGLQIVIPAFARVRAQYPTATLVLANAVGDYAAEVRRMLSELPEGSYRCIAFEPDVAALLQAFDVFVHVPIDATSEAYGQVYVEALAAGRPMVCTLSGIAHDVIVHEQNALVVPYEDVNSTAESILRLLADRELARALGAQGQRDVAHYDVTTMARSLERIYQNA